MDREHACRNNDCDGSCLSDENHARSSAPEAHEGEAVAWGVRWSGGHITPFETERSARNAMGDHVAAIVRLGVIHPAAPSADKLRFAVEALPRWDIYNGGVTEDFVIEADFKGDWVRYDDIDQALEALLK